MALRRHNLTLNFECFLGNNAVSWNTEREAFCLIFAPWRQRTCGGVVASVEGKQHFENRFSLNTLIAAALDRRARSVN